MFIIFILLTRAGAEWVEISQQHYRKPIRSNFNFPAVGRVVDLPQSTKTHTYTNESLQEHVWNKGNINKVPKLGNVQRVRLDTNPVKAPSLHGSSISDANRPLNFANKTDGKATLLSIKTKQEDYNLYDSFEFQSSSINSARHINKNNDEATVMSIDSKDEEKIEEMDKNKKTNSNQISKDGQSILNKYSNNIKPTSGIKTKEQVENVSKVKKFSTVPPTTSASNVMTKRIGNQGNDKINFEEGSLHKINQSRMKVNKGVVTEPNNKTDDPEITFENDNVHDITTGSTNPTHTLENGEEHLKNGKPDENYIRTPDNKAAAIENLIKCIKVVADTIKKNTRETVLSKTRYLENLKNSILSHIEDLINAAWPDDDHATTRQRRATQPTPTSRGHVQIPSSESALMTISFLTFAVFLIKLVLQVIQTYKNKAMMVAPAIVATVGRVARRITKSKP